MYGLLARQYFAIKTKLKLSNLKLLDISMCLTGFHKNNTTPHANQKHARLLGTETFATLLTSRLLFSKRFFFAHYLGVHLAFY